MEAQKSKPVEKPKLPAGWHQVGARHPGHKNTKEDVISAFEADTTLDEDLKIFLLAKIRKMDCRALEVHAHLTDEKGALDLSLHLKPLF